MISYRDKQLYIDLVKRIAQQSRAVRLKVGALLVNNGNIVIGYNGTPAGWDNACEDKNWNGEFDSFGDMVYELKTKSEVIHAEENCYGKAMRTGFKTTGSTLVCTHAPCLFCSKLIYGSGTTHVVYIEDYRSTDGIDFLRKCGIIVEKYKE